MISRQLTYFEYASQVEDFGKEMLLYVIHKKGAF